MKNYWTVYKRTLKESLLLELEDAISQTKCDMVGLSEISRNMESTAENLWQLCMMPLLKITKEKQK